ncbi:GntR family transcriptional regulator [soil metagenome]
MIQIDPANSAPVGEQLVEQLRFHIASGTYRSGDRLPSTRVLARQLGISFHTVRKAYHVLEAEGVLASRKGSGFSVIGARVPSAADRMERGAAVVQEALQRLVGLGLKEDEVEYILDEQRQFFEAPGSRRRFVFAATNREVAEACAQQISQHLVQQIEASSIADLHRQRDAEIVISPHESLRSAMQALGGPEHISVSIQPSQEALERTARLGNSERITLITRLPETIESLSESLRQATGFAGIIHGSALTVDREQIGAQIRRADLVLYTPAVRRRVKPLLGERSGANLGPEVGRESIDRLKAVIGV